MFTFKNPNTPIIVSGTVVEHNGQKFTIISNVFQYFYDIRNESDESVGLIPMGLNFNWAGGVAKVEHRIRKMAA